ncbi:hypothetical protein GCM10008938_21390 [Deinococcus roseus]|uniref:Uncharacterized protein n=1 Tax=Deinococcus roseus TaxID=392414 RepID=A0ABQ2CZ41_9DEIO|nr:hypothetical protein GCM10008938_21390 [Deinococcus roseus]
MTQPSNLNWAALLGHPQQFMGIRLLPSAFCFPPSACYHKPVKELFSDLWRIAKIFFMSAAVPVALYLLLLWAGVLK